MSDDHKAALARGREESRIVRRYLEMLDEFPVPNERSPDAIRRDIEVVRVASAKAGELMRAELSQVERKLEADLQRRLALSDPSVLEAEFVVVARSYGDRKGISYAAWREVGVPPKTLERAGIPEMGKPRSRRPGSSA